MSKLDFFPKDSFTIRSFFDNNDFFNVLLDNHPDYIYFKNKDSKFIKVNKKAAEVLGLDHPDEIIGKTDFDFFPDIAEKVRSDEKRIMESGDPQINVPLELRLADGSSHWISMSKVPFYDENKEVAGIVCISRDITKTKKLEKLLEERNTILQQIFDSSPNCMYIKDRNGNYLIANRTIADLYQTTPEEMIGKSDAHFVEQAVLKPFEASFFEDMDKKTIETKEKQVIPSEPFAWNDGTIHYFQTTKLPITYREDADCVLGISVDITAVKKAESERRENALKFKSLFDTINSGVAIYESVDDGADFILKGFNKAAERIEGVKKEDIVGKPVTQVFPGVKEFGIFTVFQQVWKTGIPEFFPLTIYKDEHNPGSWRENWIYKLPTGEIVAIYDDVTDRKKNEEALKESKEKYKRLVEKSPDITYIYGSKSGGIFWSNRVEEILGFSPNQLRKDACLWTNSIHPDDLPKVQQIIDSDGDFDTFDLTYRIKDVRGNYHWFHDRSISVRKENGEKIIEGLATDITSRKNIEQQLLESEKKLKLKLDSVLSPDVKVKTEDFANIINTEEIQSLMDDFYELTHIGIAVVDMSGKILVATGWQDICTKFHRINPETKMNCIESDLYLSQHVKPGEYVKYKCKNNMWDIATPIVVGGKRMGTVFLGQFFYEDESIDYSFFEQQAERYGFDKNAYMEALEKVPRWNEDTISIVMDFYSKLSEIIAKLGYINLKLAKMVEKHKQSEKKLQKAHEQLQEINKNLEDMVSQRTKELSNAIKIKDEFIHQLGHDLKTPLGPLISLLPIIKNHVIEPKDEEMITVIQRNVYYMKNLVKKTLELAQLNSPNYSLDFNSFSLKNLIGEVLEKNSSLFGDNNVNLINTISEDMEVYADKLRLVEVFDNLFSNSIKYAKNDVNVILSAEKQTDSVVISIRDDGVGLTSEQIKHVFDEFYKTDESRHDFDSSGLGLPICRRIIEKHGGRIWVESEGPQRGSIFYFTLPLNP